MSKKYWLMKSEPESYSIDQMKKDKKALWDGVRNYQARNFMMKDMKRGDKVLFYHSNIQPPGVVGRVFVSQEAQIDPTAFDKKSPYYDPKSTPEKPRWFCVELQFEKKFSKMVSLDEIRQTPSLKNMLLLKKAQRLSVQPISKKDFLKICQMAED